MQGQRTAAFMTEDFMGCLAGIRGNIGLYRTLVAEFVQQTGRAVDLLSEDLPDIGAIKVKIVTVTSVVAGMHKASLGDSHKKARMLAAEALVKLDAFGMKYFKGHFLSENRMGPVLAQDMVDQAGSLKKKAGRKKEDPSLVRT